MQAKKNIPLIVGLSIPIVMILAVAASIYLPGFFAQPTYDFLYQSYDSYQYDCRWEFRVTAGKVVRTERTRQFPEQVFNECDATFYRYDAEKDESAEITFEDAQKLTLQESPVSPEGYEVAYGNGRGGMFPFFDSGYSNDVYLKKGVVSKKINVQGSSGNHYYYGGFQFLGWILP
jgi:hypothetical protein